MKKQPRRLVIVGGVAAGASAAAKARRMSEDIEIVLVEAGPYISFANCGLPYYVGGEIQKRESLFVADAALFRHRFDVDVRTETRVLEVDAGKRRVLLSNPEGTARSLTYDRLILATGADSQCPPIPGIDCPHVYTLRTVPDADGITRLLNDAPVPGDDLRIAGPQGKIPKRVLVIGAGYIGLEAAEQFLLRGVGVTVVELADQVMPALDREMAFTLEGSLREAGAEVMLADAVTEIRHGEGSSFALTKSGKKVPFDVSVLAVGVRPAVDLAEQAGVAIGATGAIQVDEFQRTSVPGIYAAGDNSEVRDLVLERPAYFPLAGPANKAGRVAGANAALDLMDVADSDPARLRFRGALGTAIVRVCGVTAAETGLTEKKAQAEGIRHTVIYMSGLSHAGYYPGADSITLKIVYAPETGRLLGAQAVGKQGVDKRIDALATAITAGMAIDDLEQLDLCYAPPFGSAKDITILAGFAGCNSRRAVMPDITAAQFLEELAGGQLPAILDVRTPDEFAQGHLEGAINIPVDELRSRLNEVPRTLPLVTLCRSGYRSYLAQRILMNRGWSKVRNVQGGFEMVRLVQSSRTALSTHFQPEVR